MQECNYAPTPELNQPPSIAIGIIAWNEEKNIQAAIESLLEQSLFAELAAEKKVCRIVCVCNGCVDSTASIARDLLDAATLNHAYPEAIAYEIVELELANKLNSLNHLFQQAAPDSADMLMVMDADITIGTSSALADLRAALDANPQAWFSIPVGVKQLDQQRKLATNLSTQGSGLHNVATPKNPNWVPGQLYCIRRSIAKAIYFPRELIADDMFLSAIAHSDFLRIPLNPPEKSTILKVHSATYLYEPYLGLREFLANPKRQAMAHVLQKLLVDWAYSELTESQRGITTFSESLRAKDAQEENWLRQRLNTTLKQKRLFWQLLPNIYYTWPLRAALEGMRRGGLLLLPIALVRFCAHLIGLYLANSAFRKGQTYFWVDKAAGTAKQDA